MNLRRPWGLPPSTVTHGAVQHLADQVHAALDLTAMPPVALPASQSLQANLERSMAQYAARAEQLQAQIDNATDELHDVRRAQEAATAALDALIGEVAQHALNLELSA